VVQIKLVHGMFTRGESSHLNSSVLSIPSGCKRLDQLGFQGANLLNQLTHPHSHRHCVAAHTPVLLTECACGHQCSCDVSNGGIMCGLGRFQASTQTLHLCRGIGTRRTLCGCFPLCLPQHLPQRHELPIASSRP
jgi:hypothetical protein